MACVITGDSSEAREGPGRRAHQRRRAGVARHAGEQWFGVSQGYSYQKLEPKETGRCVGSHRGFESSGSPSRGRDGGVRRRGWCGARGGGAAGRAPAPGTRDPVRTGPVKVVQASNRH